MLSQQARQRLIEASSKGKKDSTLKQAIQRIDQVLYELHGTEPMSFVTTAHKNEEGVIFFNDNIRMLEERNFYDYPVKVSGFKSYVNPLNA